MGYKIWFTTLFIACLIFSSCGSRRGTVLRRPDGSYPTESSRSAGTASRPGTSRPTGTPSVSGQAYIERYKHIAVAEMNQYGIPASIKLAQALLESGNGNSYLAREANNHFGIKCGGSWNGKSTRRADDGPNDCFRVYRNPDDSFRDHSQFLLRKRYEGLFMLKKDDYRGWAHGLKKAGYATNPRYAQLLIDLIERYQLYHFDREESFIEREVREEKVEEIIQEKAVEETIEPPEEVKPPVAMKIYEVKANDTLHSIAQQFQLTVAELKELNSLEEDNLYPGQLLVVSR